MTELLGGTGSPDRADVEREQLAFARYLLSQYRRPRRDVRRRVEKNSDDVRALTRLGFDCVRIQEFEWAAAAFQKALAGDPSSYWAEIGLAECYRELGQSAQAAEIYEALFRNGNKTALILQILSELPKSLTKIDLLAALGELNSNLGTKLDVADWQRAYIEANALDKAGRHSDAWVQFAAYSALRRKQLAHDTPERAESHNAALASVRQRCNRVLVGREVEEGLPCSLFIVGPSRSGRTTLEALLGSIPGIKRGFESKVTTIILQALRAAGLLAGGRFFTMAPVTRDLFRNLYLEELADRTSEPVYTNTQPNLIFDSYGISQIVPNARFIFVKRDLDDNALKIYMQDYDDLTGHSYSLSIDSVYNYLIRFYDTVDHLTAMLPDISSVVRYEDMVENPKAVIDIATDLCGLSEFGGPLLQLSDDRGCAAPYREFIAAARGDR